MTTIIPTPQAQVLDPCLLGRPVHLLHLFAAQLRDDLTQALRLHQYRRYWSAFQVEQVAFDRAGADGAGTRWLSYAAPAGPIAYSMERGLLLGVLGQRYGRADPAAPVDEAAVRVTATEERLAAQLGRQMAGVLARRVELNLAARALAAAPAAPAAELQGAPCAAPAAGTWRIGVTMRAVGSAQQGQLWFALDKELMSGVLRGLLPQRHRVRKGAASLNPLASRLQLTLSGRLMSKEMPLGSLFDLRVGDIIPVSLSRTDVLLDDSRLFTAAVSEHKGKLCLTSFEDAE